METHDIDRDKLRQLAADGTNTTADISEKLGLGGPHNLHYHLNKDADLKRIFEEGREAAGKLRARPGEKSSAKKKSSKKSAAPPRNGNAKGGVSNDLLRKLILEFNHIDVYGEVSEHFDEIRQEMGALL